VRGELRAQRGDLELETHHLIGGEIKKAGKIFFPAFFIDYVFKLS